MKYKLQHTGHKGEVLTYEFEAIFLDQVLEHYRFFLKGCGFVFDGEIEIVDLNSEEK